MIRSILTGCFFLSLAAISFFSGSGFIQQGKLEKPAPSFPPFVKGIAAQRGFPVVEYKSFAIVLYAHNAASWCERSLRSIFEQDYEYYRVLFVDDGSTDGTFELAQQFIVDNQQDHRVIAIRNETPLGPVGSLYRAAEHCLDKEILLPIDGNNWFVNDAILTRLNQVFQNPDTWIAFGQSIQYPLYQVEGPPSFDPTLIEKKGFRIFNATCPSLAFYSALFKSIHLPDLFTDGHFSQMQLSYLLPLLEQSGGRFRSISEPFVFSNGALRPRAIQSLAQESAALKELNPYRPLTQFPLPSVKKEGAVDVVIFSYDRPLQLYAYLESIQRYLGGNYSLTVLYRVSDARFDAAYGRVKSAFPQVRYIKQSDTPRKDFKPLLVQAIFNSPAEYVLFGVDDIVMKDFVDLNFCRQMLEKTGAYGFYLRFGRHIHHSYMFNKPIALPPSIPLSHGVYVWDTKKGEIDWGFPNCMDMTIYRKSDLKQLFTEMKYKTPNSLEFNWAQHPPANRIGLYFEQSKMVNLPLNIVNPSDCAHMNYMTAEELLMKFDQGFKIDIDPLFRVENPSPHFDYIPEFVPR